MNSGKGSSSIKVITESWRLELNRENIDFNAFYSFSKSIKDDVIITLTL